MSKRILGRDLEVSSIGLGCMGMSHAYGKPSDKTEAEKLLQTATDSGYTFFDTAEVYGTASEPHHNELLLGEILKPYRNQIKIASKCGLSFDKSSQSVNKALIPDSRPEVIKKSLEGSLKRLQTDHLDLYYIHRVDPGIPIEETAGVMKELIEQGKITHWGISEATEEIIRKAHKVCPLTAIQNRYSMMYRNYESLFPMLEELQIGFVAFSPLANGFLTCRYDEHSTFEKNTDYRSIMPQFSTEGISENQKLVEWLKIIAAEKNATPAQISLAWMLAKNPFLVPIPGTRNLKRLTENIQAESIHLSAEEVAKIDNMLEHIPMSQVFGGSKVKK